MGATEAVVSKKPMCDLCIAFEGKPDVEAHYDGATKSGSWAYMCEMHFQGHGVGLGLGRGQRLVLSLGNCEWCGEQLTEDDERAELVRDEKSMLVHAEPCGAELLRREWRIA